MTKYLVEQDCDLYISGNVHPGCFKGEVFANSLEEAIEKLENGEVEYEVIVKDHGVNGNNEIKATLIEEDNK